MHHLPRADGDSRYVYPIGTKVRKRLDHPKCTTGQKLFGKFRSTDYRWDQKISTVTSVYLAPDRYKMIIISTNNLFWTDMIPQQHWITRADMVLTSHWDIQRASPIEEACASQRST